MAAKNRADNRVTCSSVQSNAAVNAGKNMISSQRLAHEQLIANNDQPAEGQQEPIAPADPAAENQN